MDNVDLAGVLSADGAEGERHVHGRDGLFDGQRNVHRMAVRGRGVLRFDHQAGGVHGRECAAQQPADRGGRLLRLGEAQFKHLEQRYAKSLAEMRNDYLQARPETLIARVRKRGVDMERRITDAYLTLLAERYSRFFYNYSAAPVMVVNSENLNFVDRDDDFRLLLERIEAMRGQRGYFNRGE